MAGVQDSEKRGVLVEVKNVIDMEDMGIFIEEEVCDMPDIEDEVVVDMDMDMSAGIVDVATEAEVEVVVSGMSILKVMSS